jgi:exodeoxyribonuclease-3
MTARIIAWNVNSVRVREARLVALLERHKPAALCLQELKCVDADFPHAAVRAVGYEATTFGQKTYNGVAVLAPVGTVVTDVQRGFEDDVDDPQARVLAVTVNGVRVVSAYVPNGGELGSEKWAYKQAWYARLGRWLDRVGARDGAPFVLCGDFNVAWDERDVAKPDNWRDGVLFHPDAVALLHTVVQGAGLADTLRLHHAEPNLLSWWDYRNLGFQKNDGLRIDYIFANAAAAAQCSAAGIDRDERRGQQPSDHAPVWADFTR